MSKSKGTIGETALLRELRRAMTLRDIATILRRVLDGEALLTITEVAEYDRRTGEPSAFRDDPYHGYDGALWHTYDWNTPTVKGSPCAKVLLALKRPVIVGDVLIQPVGERGDGGGTIPAHIKYEKADVL